MKKVVAILLLFAGFSFAGENAKQEKVISDEDIKCLVKIEFEIGGLLKEGGLVADIGRIRIAEMQAYLIKGYTPCQVLKILKQVDKNFNWNKFLGF